jgi:predicted secreted protein
VGAPGVDVWRVIAVPAGYKMEEERYSRARVRDGA